MSRARCGCLAIGIHERLRRLHALALIMRRMTSIRERGESFMNICSIALRFQKAYSVYRPRFGDFLDDVYALLEMGSQVLKTKRAFSLKSALPAEQSPRSALCVILR
jgi:hypothetical protein